MKRRYEVGLEKLQFASSQVCVLQTTTRFRADLLDGIYCLFDESMKFAATNVYFIHQLSYAGGRHASGTRRTAATTGGDSG